FGDDFVYRPKSGFSLPLRDYFQDPRFVSMMEERLLPAMRSRGVVNAEAVRALWQSLPAQPPAASETLWISVAFELWCEHFLDAGARWQCA
ncbi:MAG TPA: asparagine synthase-related protein, partial [Vicinamibacterales bacterium]|nr:asparagine synthase-related protein [Vicinamibacterales bacterium]